jgi:DNA-binding NarL/FixJ family response regulator
MALATHPTPARRSLFGVSPLRTARKPAYAIVVHRAEVVRAGISSLLTSGGVGEVSGVESVFEALRIAGSHAPQVVLFDYTPSTGPEICRLLGSLWPRPALVAIVSSNQSTTGRDCLDAGADAAIAIDAVTREGFLECLQHVLVGGGPVVAGFRAEAHQGHVTTVGEAPTAGLTRREREMLYLIGQGLSNREIADALVLSVKTVETHRSNLSRKLKIRSRAGLMRLAMGGGDAA